MELLKNRKFNHLIREINRPIPVFSPAPKNNIQEQMLKAVVLLAKQLNAYIDITSIKGPIKVLIAGCDHSECRGIDCYKLLNKLLGTEREWDITLIGLETTNNDPTQKYKLTTKADDNRINTHLVSSPLSLSEYLNQNEYPDILVLNHPGFEEFFDSWLDNDTGIADCLKRNIPVIGASYGTDEYKIDDFHLQAFGMKITDHKINDLCLRPSLGDLDDLPHKMRPIIASGICDWGRTIWQIESNGLTKNKEKLDVLGDFEEISLSIGHYLLENNIITIPQEAAGEHLYKRNGDYFLRIYAQYTLDFKLRYIFDEESGQIVTRDIEIEVEPDENLFSDFHKIREIMINIYRTHIKPNLSTEEHHHDEHFDPYSTDDLHDMNELLNKLTGGNVQGEKLQEIMGAMASGADINQMLGFQEKRSMSNSDKEVLNLVEENRIDELLLLPDDLLLAYEDEYRRNLAHLAAITNSLPILHHAISIGVPFDVRDTDDFSFLDTAVEYGSLDVINESVSNGVARNILNSQNTRGCTALHQAVTRNNKAAYDLLIELGADDNLKNIVGMRPRDNQFR
ncbi:ankyrin repeat domain-containing protein [Photobacterium leiognathi]|uniref:ankyrin repeat domain-containing protein n=1 Tax=Photobacterium leiognathi TaxID=553611 RepID=UPI002980A3AD|nr:ankyrin repeat domain-containing protein [Photobacterium leiognathi]